MELQKPKIALYAKRAFGEKMNASFDFIKENRKLLLKAVTYLILPISLVQALTLNGLMGGLSNTAIIKDNVLPFGDLTSLGVMFFLNYIGYIILSVIGGVLLSSLIYAMMQKYNESDERLHGVSLRTLKPLLLRNIWKMFKLAMAGMAFGIIVLVIIGLLIAITPFSAILTFPLLIACSIPLVLMIPIYLFEDISIMGTFKKTFRLGFATWGGVFAIYFVMGLIGSVLQGVTMMPWYIVTLVKYFFVMSDTGGGEATMSVGYSFVLYLLAIFQTYGAYLSMIFAFVGVAYQYGHASEVVDSVTVEEDIDNFDKL